VVLGVAVLGVAVLGVVVLGVALGEELGAGDGGGGDLRQNGIIEIAGLGCPVIDTAQHRGMVSSVLSFNILITAFVFEPQ
jgi:hypothetical protein